MSNTSARQQLRPVERRVLEMQDEGLSVDEIAARFNRSPDFVDRMLTWTEIPRNGNTVRGHLSPIQRRVLDMRADGESHDEIASKFNRGEASIRQIEGLAHFKESLRLLSRD